MQITTIYQTDHSVLRNPAQSVPLPIADAMREFCQQLTVAMIQLNNAVGLAATQLGFPYRLFAMQIPQQVVSVRGDVTELLPPTVLINPSYTPLTHKKQLGWEGCFSVPDKMGEVWRYQSIYYEGLTPAGDFISGEAHGLKARIIQHEIGHLNGELITDLFSAGGRFGNVETMRKIRSMELASKECV